MPLVLKHTHTHTHARTRTHTHTCKDTDLRTKEIVSGLKSRLRFSADFYFKFIATYTRSYIYSYMIRYHCTKKHIRSYHMDFYYLVYNNLMIRNLYLPIIPNLKYILHKFNMSQNYTEII